MRLRVHRAALPALALALALALGAANSAGDEQQEPNLLDFRDPRRASWHGPLSEDEFDLSASDWEHTKQEDGLMGLSRRSFAPLAEAATFERILDLPTGAMATTGSRVVIVESETSPDLGVWIFRGRSVVQSQRRGFDDPILVRWVL